MKNEDTSSKKMLFGLVVAGIVGGSFLYYLQNAKSQKEPLVKKIGKTIAEVGEILENWTSATTAEAVEKIEQKIPSKGEVFSTLADWVGSGLSLLKHIKKG